MDRTNIFNVIKTKIVEVLPELENQEIQISQSLKDLGANSVDRVEISQNSMEALGLKIPRTEMGGIENIQSLVDLFHKHLSESVH
jgi:polyketide biosynthesis acyl carrier protein